MKAAYMTGVGQIEYRDIPKPEPGPGEVLVALRHVGVCGSDLHYYENGRIGNAVVREPMILGHECAGIVESVGEGVTTHKPGDAVALEPGVTCGHCEFCRTGRYNLCPSVVFFATPPYDGVFAEYVCHPAQLAFHLPQGVGTEAGALIEPLAVGFHAVAQSGARTGQSALILGSGCIGLTILLCLRYIGVREIYVTDMVDSRLMRAGSLGAKATYRSDADDIAACIADATKGRGVDHVFEASGAASAILQTARLVCRGGTVTTVGMSVAPVVDFDLGSLMEKEATLRTVFRYRHVYPAALAAVAGGLPIDDIVSHIFNFNDIPKALDACIRDKAKIIKAVITL